MEAEAFFKEAVARLRDKHLQQYPDHPPIHTFSPEFEKNMQQLFVGQRRSQRKSYVGHVWRQAACFALVTTVGLGACFVGVGAWSNRFLKMVEERYDTHTDIHFAPTGEGAAQTSNIPYTLSHVPEGFRRVSHLYSPDSVFNHVWFENDQDLRILFDQSIAEGTGLGLNTEGAELEEIQFRGHPARFLENKGMCTLLWYDDKYCFTITTDLSREETMAVADNVQVKENPFPTLQPIPIETLPEDYPSETAQTNGDVVFQESGIYHVEKLESFVKACDEGKDGAVRLITYSPKGQAIVSDLQMENGRLYYIRDEHRWPDSEQPWERGEEYDSISIFNTGKEHVVLLYSSHYDTPTEVLRYPL